MSGTSLDGLDLCYAKFTFNGNWSFEILASHCVDYDKKWRSNLGEAHTVSSNHIEALGIEFGQFIGENINAFLGKSDLHKPELICSHGHTVFHEPSRKYTLQIGDGQTIANTTGLTCVSDFRSLDVSLGGQGAPLVPIGDKLLFSEYDACLNLGGFSNISFKENGERRAFDICPVNIVLNPLANSVGHAFDQNGDLAKSGRVSQELLGKLNNLSIYGEPNRPSLAREWLENAFTPILRNNSGTTNDKLRTVVEHAAIQIASVINSNAEIKDVLVTGGGANNTFLLNRISALSKAKINIPAKELIDYKEALIFAFLGVLRMRDEINVLRSVTGAERNSSSGKIDFPSAY